MSNPLSEQIQAFREAMASWRGGVRIEPDAIPTFEDLFEGWENAARALERDPPAAGEATVEDLEALGGLAVKVNAFTARLVDLRDNQLKGV